MVFELQFLDWLQTLQTTILNEIMKAVTHLGDAGALWIILAAVLLAFPKTRKSGAIVAAALIVDLVLCNGILKNIFARTRPFDVKEGISLLITAPKDFSFPVSESARRILSSHSTSLLVLFLPLARIALSRRLFFLSRIAETSAPMLSGVSPRMRTMPKAISRKLII